MTPLHFSTAVYTYRESFKNHPLRGIKRRVDAVLETLSPLFEELSTDMGRDSIPPEQLLKARFDRPLHGAQRATFDGAARLQLPVSLVCGAQHR